MRIVMPGSPGSGLSIVARAVAPFLSHTLGVPVVVEDLPGAGGLVGTAAMVRSEPDGRTVSLLGTNHLINPHVYKSIPYDALRDITPIGMLGSSPIVLVANPRKLAVRDLRELQASLSAQPGRYAYGSAGNGTILHLAGEMFLDDAKVRALHVPYKGVAPLVTALLAGEIDFAPLALSSVRQHLNSGALQAIGVASSKRVASASDIPTLAEQGMPNYLIDAWFAAVGPAGMNSAVVRRLNGAFASAFAEQEVRDAMARDGTAINVSSPEYASEFLALERTKYARLAQLAHLEKQ